MGGHPGGTPRRADSLPKSLHPQMTGSSGFGGVFSDPGGQAGGQYETDLWTGEGPLGRD